MTAAGIARRSVGNDLRLELGEGPVWDEARGVLWWVDSEAGMVFRGTVDADVVTVIERREVGEKVGSVAPAADGGLLVAGERHVQVLDPTGAVVERIRVIEDAVQSRLNDSACDPRGRFLVGSIRLDGRSRQETLVSIDADRAVRVVADGITGVERHRLLAGGHDDVPRRQPARGGPGVRLRPRYRVGQRSAGGVEVERDA